MRLACLALLLGLAACSDSGPPKAQPPILDTVTVPATASVAVADPCAGKYLVPIQVSFHDPDDTVTSIHVEFPGVPFSQTVPFPIVSDSQELDVCIDSSLSGKTLDVTVTVIDQSGLSSNAMTRQVTLS